MVTPMREVTPTRSMAIELADERKLMRQGYEFLDEKRMLLATEMLSQLKIYQQRSDELIAVTKLAAAALAAAVERHGLDQLELYPKPQPPAIPETEQSLFLGLVMLSAGKPPEAAAEAADTIDPSPEAKACRAAFEKLLWASADLAARVGNLNRLAREYRRAERRARALEKVLLPEVETAIKMIDEQLDMMEREEAVRTRWSRRTEVDGDSDKLY
jgi:V/A-type H+-transporting ATPase subunit D